MKNLIFSILLLANAIIFGQNSDPKAESILNNTIESLKSKPNLSLTFEYEFSTSNSNYKQEEKGKMTLFENKYRIDMQSLSYIFDGKKLYSINHFEKEITVDSGINSTNLNFIETLKNYKKDYIITLFKTKITNIRKEPIYILKLYPKSQSQISNIEIKLFNNQIQKFEQHFQNGNKMEIKINDWNSYTTVNKDLFNFNKNSFKGYTITNL